MSKMPVLRRTKKQDRLQYQALVAQKLDEIAPLPIMFRQRMRGLISKLHPWRLHMKPTEDHCAYMGTWILCFGEGRQRNNAIQKMHQLKELLNVHSDLLQAMDGADLDAESAALQAEMLSAFAHDATKVRDSMAGAFVAALFELRKIARVADLSQCGDITLVQAVDFCIPCKGFQRKYELRVRLLERTGFRHSTLLAEQCQLAWKCDKECDVLTRNKLSVTVSQLLRLWWLFKQSPQAACKELTAAELIAVFASMDQTYEGVSVARLFTCVAKLLDRCGRNDTLATVRQKLDPAVTGESKYSWFSSQSQWHADVARRLVETIMAHSALTHFTEQWQERWRISSGRILILLLKYVPETYELDAEQKGTTNGLKWFFNTCTLAQAEAACQALLRQHAVCNELVKSQRENHHAEPHLYYISNFFKIGVAALQGDASELHRLDSKVILRGIANKRIAAEGTVRRTYTQEEVESMLKLQNKTPGTRC